MSPEEIKKQKQVIIKNIGFNSLLIVIVLIYSVIFLSPGFDELSVKIAGAQQFFERIQKLTTNGTDIEDLNSMLATTTAQNAKTSLQKILSKPESKAAVSEIIKKEDGFTGSYVAWLNEKVEKLSELQKQGYYYNKILGEIIPTFTNVAASSELLSLKSAESNQKSVVTNRIELTEFVKFFEEDLLKKYKITSSSKIGIGSVEFKSVKGSAGSTIGSFTLPIDIEGDNTNILAFIRGIQSSGRFPSNFFEPKSSEFWKSISLSSSELSSLSNLLVSIDSLSLDNLPTENLAATNKGTITLRFYVKWLGNEEVREIRNAVNQKYAALQVEIDKQIKLYSQFCASVSDKKVCTEQANVQAHMSLKWLSTQLAADIKAQKDATKGLRLTDVVDAAEFDALGWLYSRYKDYAQQYDGYANVLKKAINKK